MEERGAPLFQLSVRAGVSLAYGVLGCVSVSESVEMISCGMEWRYCGEMIE